MTSYAVGNPSGHWGSAVPAVSPHSLLCTPSPLRHTGRAVCRGEKPLVHISSCSGPHCPPHGLFPPATSRRLMGTASASRGSVLGLAGMGSGQHGGSCWCCSQKPPLQPFHSNLCHRNPAHDPRETPHRCTQHHTALFPKGRCPGEAARHWDRAAAGTQGKGLSVFVSAPAPWPWQCPRRRCSCSPGHRACMGSWMPPCRSLQRCPT